MKMKIYNHDHIRDTEITDHVIRVKALMVNRHDEILLGEAFGTVQFPGGHLEEGETLKEGLKREVKEETGIALKEEYEPFFAIKHYLKDYPVVGHNRSIEIFYFYISTDQKYNIKKTNLDDQERTGDFKLQYVPFKNVKETLIRSIPNNQINGVVVSEMLLALKEANRKYRRGFKLWNKKDFK